MWNYCGFYFFPAEIVFAIISMIYILLVVFFYSQSTIICSESVVGMWFEVWFGYVVRGLRCVCCWQWRHHNNGSWSHSGVFVVGFEQVNGGWVSNVFEDCCVYICLFNKKYKNCKWKEKKISNRNHSENLIKVKLK